jgi:hypothetical protein
MNFQRRRQDAARNFLELVRHCLTFFSFSCFRSFVLS